MLTFLFSLLLTQFATQFATQSLVIVNDLDCSAKVIVHHTKQTEGFRATIKAGNMVTYQTIANVDTITLDIFRQFIECDCGCSPHLPPYNRLERTRETKYFYQVKVPIKQFKAFYIAKPICQV